MSGAAGCTSHFSLAAQGTPTGPASWSSTYLDGLYSWLTVLTPFPAEVQLPSIAAVAWPWCRLPAGRWAVLIPSYGNTSDLVMFHMMSVEYAFSLSLVFCLDSASDISVFGGQGGLNQPGQRPLTATDWLCWATAACGLQTDDLASRSCQAAGNNTPGTSFSAIAKKKNEFLPICMASCF